MRYSGWLSLALLLFFSCAEEAKEPVSYMLNELNPSATGIDFMNEVEDTPEHSIINYIYFYNGAGLAVGDINNDALPDLYFVSNEHENKLYLNKGDMTFEDISETANIAGSASWNTGATMVDINGDGYLDIYVCAVSNLLDFKGHNELFINNGDNTFTEQSEAYGLDFEGYSTQSYFFDFDKDNDLDVYLVNHAVHTTLSHGKAALRNERAPLVGDVLLRNDNGRFTDVSEAANIYGGVNGYGLSASIADFNNDGWDDIYVCNDFHEDDYYYINNQDGTFKETLGSSFNTISRFSMGSDAADINGDGYQDLITLDMLPKDERVLKETEGDDAMFNMQVHLNNLGYKDQFSRNMLQINHEGTYFHEEALFNKIADTDWSWAPLFADFDNDGQQDLFISNGILKRPNGLDFKKYVSSAFKGKSDAEGLNWLYNAIGEMPDGNVANEIFSGEQGRFKRQTGQWIKDIAKISNASVYVDLDLDGDLDIVTNNFNQYASVYENTMEGSNSLYVKLQYIDQNPEGIGSKVYAYTNGRAQMKQLFKSRGFMSSVDGALHFGLGEIATVDSIMIVWPNNKVQTLTNPEPNVALTVSYDKSKMLADFNYAGQSNTNKKFEKTDLIAFEHKEDRYNDFVEEKLIPYKVSTIGPAFAAGDIDGNGYKDLFIGGASGYASQLYMNDGNNFTIKDTISFKEDILSEDNAAAFLDADGDGDLDLYVGSGINERKSKAARLDRLYINENGNFIKSTGQIPENDLVTTSVEPYDFDKDGDTDLFIGNLSDPHSFGRLVSSYILENTGGQFKKLSGFEIKSMVTAAEWADLNADGFKDLIVTSEWNTPKIFLNNQGQLKEVSISNDLTGLWQSTKAVDMDNDGDLDILLGNLGLNSKFNLYFDGPLLLYYSDFDKNGVYETMIAYNRNGEYYPLNSKDELAAQMNVVNKIYTSHAAYAGNSMLEVMKSGTLQKADKYEAATLTSGYLVNDSGQFNIFVPFSDELQLGPINNFELIDSDRSQLLISGNSYKFNTYHGSYSSLKGYLMDLSNSSITTVSELGMDPIHEQVKTTRLIEMNGFNLLLVLTNDDKIKTYKIKK